MAKLTLLHQMPARLAAGAFILNSGLSKSGADEKTAAGIHGMAAGTYPFLGKMDAEEFTRRLSQAEIALGAALVLPFVPSLVAGAALTAFAGGLVGLYLKTPGLRRENSLRPTEQGVPIAKDTWLLGIGASLVLDSLTRRH
ncbi:hypothetical protein [Actinomadura rayongensis]|uniref:DoxX family membrane protein n=1 Tax=Actinomadura rayongensis TaxID=1429076 RepID=A0A6I4W6T5_9ACTN|nr:hypothetical protein [Actinomadura rayongensis]MXQ66449.1 hypothetical protein [Actinomadura rayongensis]